MKNVFQHCAWRCNLLACSLALLCASCPGGESQKILGQSTDPAAKRPVAVRLAAAERQNLPVYLTGLGTVKGFYTVTVRSQVDGRVEKIHFREGQEVRRNDPLALIDPRPFLNSLHQAEANLSRDTAQLKNDQRNLQRDGVLQKTQFIAEQTVADQQALVDKIAATVQADQAQVDTARLQLSYAHIVAPLSGRTGLRLVDPGNVVHANDANGLVIITQMDPIAMLFTLPEDNLPQVAAEMRKGTLCVEAWSREGSVQLGVGKVLLIDNQINAATGTMRLKAVFDNAAAKLWPNQFVKARLLLETVKDAVVVPAAAVQYGPQGAFVYCVGADSTVVAQRVSVGVTQGDSLQILRGLRGGESVVIDGQAALHPGSRVRAQSSAAAPETP
jgi:multidrug efflux system membrane fusion protein